MSLIEKKLHLLTDGKQSSIDLYSSVDDINGNVTEESWTQPILTSDIDVTGVICTSGGAEDQYGSSAFRALDGSMASNNNGTGWASNSLVVNWWKVVFPYKLRITGLIHYNRRSGSSCAITGQYFADVAMTTPIGDAISTSSSDYAKTTITGIPAQGVITDTIYFAKTGGIANSGIGELTITATKFVNNKYLSMNIPTYNKYYKYVPWTQPILTSDTSYGVVTVSSRYSSSQAGYKAFDGVKTGSSMEDTWNSAKATTGWLKWELPQKLKISQIKFYNKVSASTFSKDCQFYADEAKTIPLTSAFVAVPSSYGVTILSVANIETDVIYLDITSSTGDYIGAGEIEITAMVLAPSTADDYDTYETVPASPAYVPLSEPTYYKWLGAPFIQPVFSTYLANDGSIISASSEDTSHANYSWRAMDGLASGNNDGRFWQTNGTTTGWWKVVLPYKIAITKLVHYNRWNTTYAAITGQYFADVAMTTPIGSSFTNTTSWGTTTVYDSATPIITDTIYFNKTDGNSSSGIGELVITATKASVVSTETALTSGFDYKEDSFFASKLNVLKHEDRVVNGTTVNLPVPYKANGGYTVQDFTTVGTYTWTVPAGVTKVKVALVGGGDGASIYTDCNDGGCGGS